MYCGERNSLYNNILTPTKLSIGSNYHLFKEGVRPMWEDPINAKGGKWIFTNARSRKARLDECWLYVVSADRSSAALNPVADPIVVPLRFTRCSR